MKTAGLVLVTLLHASPSWACYNAIESQTEMVQRLQLVEFHLANAQNWQAWWFMVDAGNFHASDGMLRRAEDIETLVYMRYWQGWEYGADYFGARRGSQSNDPRYTAWFAEALAHAGNSAAARQLLRGLVERDLMPDAFAWAALANVTVGEERFHAIETCHQRATVKAYVCPPTPKVI